MWLLLCNVFIHIFLTCSIIVLVFTFCHVLWSCCSTIGCNSQVGHDGTIMKMGGRSNKSSAGYDMTSLMIGSEGTQKYIMQG